MAPGETEPRKASYQYYQEWFLMTQPSQRKSSVAAIDQEGSSGELATPTSSINHLYGTWKNADVVYRKVETYGSQRIL
ncbi:MAG: hypothetical protein AAF349_23565 [Cyanobacteria bacterium P01_A01_bin.68]